MTKDQQTQSQNNSAKTALQELAEMDGGATPPAMIADDPRIVAELDWEPNDAPEVKIGRTDDIRRLATALSRAQGEMENAKKNRANAHFNTTYADLGAVVDATRDPLARHQIAKIQTINFNETECWLDSMLMHGPSGQYISARYPLPKSAMAKPQDFVSAITYARRTSLATMTGIATEDAEDDDGNIAADLGKDVNQDIPQKDSKNVSAAKQWVPWAVRKIGTFKTIELLNAWEEEKASDLVNLKGTFPDGHIAVMAALQVAGEKLAPQEPEPDHNG